MHFLAHEEIPLDAVLALQGLGHKVDWVRLDPAGLTDMQTAQRIRRDACILLTFDKEWAERAYHLGLSVDCGIIVLKLPLTSPKEVARRTVAAIRSRQDWVGHYAVITLRQVRIYRLANQS